MSNVIKLGTNEPACGTEAVAKVVQFLRDQADAIESGEERPAHKAVLTIYENCGAQSRTLTVFCNATAIERAGIMAMALHDALETD